MELISVIVPVYNVQDYLEDCVNSITSQSYKNIEIILVDDGSKDKSGRICDELKQKDDKIKVIHKENGGLSSARNAGFECAQGRYIAFVDSDDIIHKSMLKSLYDLMVKYDCAIVECGIQKFPDGERCDTESKTSENSPEVYNTEQALKLLIEDEVLHQTVWNKLYRKDVLWKEPFKKGKTNEDEFFTYRAFANTNKVVRTSGRFYFYRTRQGSIINSRYSIKRLDAVEAKDERQDFIEKNFQTLSNIALKNLYSSLIYSYQNVIKHMKGEERKKAKRIIMECKKKHPLTDSFKREIDKKERFFYSWFEVNMYTVCKFRNLLKKGF